MQKVIKKVKIVLLKEEKKIW